MATLQRMSEGLGEAWDNLLDGWRKLYHRAAGAITRFQPSDKGSTDLAVPDAQEVAMRSSGWGVLACEVFDNDDRVVVRLEAPGMEKNDFHLQVVDDYLLVRGEKHMERQRSEGGYHISECAYGSFERAIPLPAEVKTDGASAKYKRGVLQVELPKMAAAGRRRVKVDVQ
jgi:HSP20 family protein